MYAGGVSQSHGEQWQMSDEEHEALGYMDADHGRRVRGYPSRRAPSGRTGDVVYARHPHASGV